MNNDMAFGRCASAQNTRRLYPHKTILHGHGFPLGRVPVSTFPKLYSGVSMSKRGSMARGLFSLPIHVSSSLFLLFCATCQY